METRIIDGVEREIKNYYGVPYYDIGRDSYDARNNRRIECFDYLLSKDKNEREKAYTFLSDIQKNLDSAELTLEKLRKGESIQSCSNKSTSKKEEAKIMYHKRFHDGDYISQEVTVKEFWLIQLLEFLMNAVFFIIMLPIKLTISECKKDRTKKGGFH